MFGCFCYSFPLLLNKIILQDSDSDLEAFDLLDPSSSDIVIGNISVSCSVEVCNSRIFFFH